MAMLHKMPPASGPMARARAPKDCPKPNKKKFRQKCIKSDIDKLRSGQPFTEPRFFGLHESFTCNMTAVKFMHANTFFMEQTKLSSIHSTSFPYIGHFENIYDRRKNIIKKN